MEQVLIDGQWRTADASDSFQADDPSQEKTLAARFPVSSWKDCEAALDAAVEAHHQLRGMSRERIAQFLEAYAQRIEAYKDELVETAYQETGLAKSPRLADVELPRTTNQLRLAAQAAREGSWTEATIDTKSNIRSYYASIGPVCVFGPNNFPYAFGSVSGGDFAAAIAAGNPVIGKANSSHPDTTRIFAKAARETVESTEMPKAMVQLLYRISHEDGVRLVADPRVGATGYTGSRNAGLRLKGAADVAGNPIYLELSSINPVVILPGALQDRSDEIVEEYVTSCLMGTGQFCTNPGILLLLKNKATEQFLDQVAQRYQQTASGVLLARSVRDNLLKAVEQLKQAGAQLIVGGGEDEKSGYRCQNTLLQVGGADFLSQPERLQQEAFGNVSLAVIADDADQMVQILQQLEGNLTGCIYSHRDGSEEDVYEKLEPHLRQRVGRLLNDKMPTGVAVSPAMNHGGPFPATGHPGFTAVGIPASLRRFAMLQCYDNVRSDRLPEELRDKNPNRQMWRYIDGRWTTDDA